MKKEKKVVIDTSKFTPENGRLLVKLTELLRQEELKQLKKKEKQTKK